MRLKKNGKKRPIIDLSVLNLHLDFPSFKMETVAVIAKAISTGLWACSIDIQDAYFHVPMNWEFHKFLAFKIENRIFVFQFLPFGLSPAPWVFTRIIKPIKSRLHTLMILISVTWTTSSSSQKLQFCCQIQRRHRWSYFKV